MYTQLMVADSPFTFKNFFMSLSAVAPLLVAFFLVMVSLMNENVKGIVYLAGALLSLTLNYPIQAAMGVAAPSDLSPACSPFLVGTLGRYASPSGSSLFLGFTFAYLFIPMFANGIYNYGIISSLLILICSNGPAICIMIGRRK